MLTALLTSISKFRSIHSRKFNKIMSDIRIKRKHFDNPFSDYDPDKNLGILDADHIKDSYEIREKLEHKWNSVSEKINKYLKHSDLSVYTGTSGVALLYLKRDCENRENLLLAQNLAISNKISSKRRLTFLTGDAGPLAIGAVISHKLNDSSTCKNLVKSLVSLKTDAINYKAECPDEFLYGRAGYLFSLLYVNSQITPPPIEESLIKSVIDTILKSGSKLAEALDSPSSLMYKWHDTYYLGAAHGLTGILYLLLQVPQYLDETQLHDLIKPTVDYLASLKFPSGNYPSSLDSQSGDKYVQWCHGAPGFLYLFSQAYKVFKQQKYLDFALKCGDVVWSRGLLRKGYSICHGASGNAYCFLELYQTTDDEKHLYRALKFAEWCLDYTKLHEEYSPDHPLSLFEGIAGPMHLLLDIQKPKEAKFPAFTL